MDSGSRAARFERLVAPHERQVYFTCLSFMGTREDAEDCAQEALLKAYRKMDSFKGQSQFSTWLYTLVSRVCLDALRKRREVVSLDVLREEGFEPQDEEAEAFLQLEQKERKAAVREALAKLPVDFRAALILVDLQGLPYREAAAALEVPEGTLKSRVNRGRKALYKLLLYSRELFDTDSRQNGERREAHELS